MLLFVCCLLGNQKGARIVGGAAWRDTLRRLFKKNRSDTSVSEDKKSPALPKWKSRLYSESVLKILKFTFEDNAAEAPVTSKTLARNLNHEILDLSVPLLGNESFKFTLLLHYYIRRRTLWSQLTWRPYSSVWFE